MAGAPSLIRAITHLWYGVLRRVAIAETGIELVVSRENPERWRLHAGRAGG